MRYALIKNSKVENIILADADFANTLQEYDFVYQLSDSDRVEIGYTWTGSGFTAPAASIDLVALVGAAREFGSKLINEMSAENIALGITQAGKTNSVRKASQQVINALQTGSLYDAIYELKAIPVQDRDATFLSDARILAAVNKIEDYLGATRSTSA